MSPRQAIPLITAAVLSFLFQVHAGAMTLQEAVEQAGPEQGYDKFVRLETGLVYTGGLQVGPSFSVIHGGLVGAPGYDIRIEGSGAVLDLRGGQLCVSYCPNRLDLEDCVIINGNVRFRGINTADTVAIPTGSVRHVTFYAPHDYGIRLQGAGREILLEDNLVVSALDTGFDFVYTHGMSNPWLPTGINVAFSVQAGFYGTPVVRRNWSFHEDPDRNADPLNHFGML